MSTALNMAEEAPHPASLPAAPCTNYLELNITERNH